MDKLVNNYERDGYIILKKCISKKISSSINIPLIASGGAGEIKHFIDVFKDANVDAALAASVFHYGYISIYKLKKKLIKSGIIVR